jgi:hypothetical protein
LHDLKKVYRACVESAVVHDKTGPALAEIAHTYHSDRTPLYRELFEWANDTPDIDPRFSITLQLFANTTDDEVRQQIINDWTGYPMKVSDIRAALHAMGEMKIRVGASKKGQELQRFAFLSRFFHSAGYTGWLILLDEADMISCYSPLQRMKAYSHLSQLYDTNNQIPKLATIVTISEDYTGQVLFGKKNDRENIPARYGMRREAPLVPFAERGMDVIQRKGIPIRPYTREHIDEVYQRVRRLYAEAYNWEAPDLMDRPDPNVGMRRCIRSWINAWDFRRLYDTTVSLVTDEVTFSYEEDADMQTNSDDEEPVITL